MSEHQPWRVLHVIAQLTHGGAEFQLKGLVEHGTGDDVEHAVACLWRTGADDIVQPIREAGREVFFLDKKRGLDLGVVRRLANLIRSWQPDVVHTWLMSAGLWGRLATVLAPGPAVVAAFRGEQMHRWPGGKFLDRWLDRRTDMCIVNSKRLQTILADRLGRAPETIPVVVNGLDASRFTPGQPSAGERRRLGLPADGLIVTMVGTIRPMKNWPLFIEVARTVCAENPNVHFVGVGGGPGDDQMLAELRASAADLNRLHLLGKRTDVPDLLAQSDLFMLTSNSEGMPNAILEAMAAGLPVVATGCSGTVEVVLDGQTGFVAAVGDADGLAAHVRCCLADADLRASLGAASRQRVLDEFSFERMAAGHREAYLAAMARRRER